MNSLYGKFIHGFSGHNALINTSSLLFLFLLQAGGIAVQVLIALIVCESTKYKSQFI